MSERSGFLTTLATNNRIAFITASAVVAIGMGLGSVALANGMVAMKRADREVTVRGVAQRDVTANRATWAVRYSQAAYDLPEALSGVDRSTATIRAFLADHGFKGPTTAPTSAEVSVTDEYVKGETTGRKIYTVTRTIAFTTSEVAAVQKVQAAKDALVQDGIVADSVDATYEYTQLDKIKPEMIADAARDARRAADKFASDSGSTVGKIKSATQGYFSVSGRDATLSPTDEEYGTSSSTAATPDQRVRVVTTIDYYLD